MSTAFIGGSRKIGRLDEAVKARIGNIINGGLSVVVGDADGADKAVQEYLAQRAYRNVLVFCTGAECRNNIGGWATRHVKSDREKKDFLFYTAKDVAMSEEADYGFMLWEGRSVGTLQNILNLVEREKQVVVYLYPEKRFITVRTFADLGALLERCPSEAVRKFEQRLGLTKRMKLVQRELNLTGSVRGPFP